MAIRVGVVTDVRIYREGVCALLAGVPGIEVVGATDLRHARDILDGKPAILILDVACGTEAADVENLAGPSTGPRIIALGVEQSAEEALKWIQAGASGYLSRTADTETLVKVVRSVHDGTFRLSQDVTSALVRRVQGYASGSDPRGCALLTRREAMIVDLIGRGLSNKEIAGMLGLGEATVKNHVHNVLRKMRFHNRAEIAAHLAHAQALPDSSPEPSRSVNQKI